MADSSFIVFAGFPGKSARDACDFNSRLLMPCAESLYRKRDKDKALPPTGLKRLIVLAVAGNVKSIARLNCCAIDGCLLERVDDGDVERRIFPADPPADVDISRTSIVALLRFLALQIF